MGTIILLSAWTVFALADLSRAVQTGLVGAGLGAIAGRVVVSRRERGGGELKGRRVRQIEVNWTLAVALLFLLGTLVTRVVFSQ